MADARTVANRFLDLAREKERSLTPMQLLKLVYIAHGWTLGLTGKPLINQKIEAWQYGPVIRSLYNLVRGYGRDVITAPIPAFPEDLSNAEDGLIQQVYDLYGDLSGIQLSNITHMPGTPWFETYEAGSFGKVIPNDLIAAHYRQLDTERESSQHQ